MRRWLPPLFLLIVVAAAGFVAVTSSALPERVASHFARGGQANGWMPRDAYTAFVLAPAVVVPLLLVALLAWLARMFPGAINLPNRAYWFEPERHAATLASLAAFAWAFGSVLALLIAGLHWAVVNANARTPPILAEAAVDALLSGFAVAIAVWILAWYVRFRRPR